MNHERQPILARKSRLSKEKEFAFEGWKLQLEKQSPIRGVANMLVRFKPS